MNVTKAEPKGEPGYPSKRQLAEGAKSLGLAALGAGALLAAGCDSMRTSGVMPVREGGVIVEEPVRLMGDIAVEPKPEVPPRSGGDIRIEPAKP
jgi:hypothetical protein